MQPRQLSQPVLRRQHAEAFQRPHSFQTEGEGEGEREQKARGREKQTPAWGLKRRMVGEREQSEILLEQSSV